jgi:hypothetical protein
MSQSRRKPGGSLIIMIYARLRIRDRKKTCEIILSLPGVHRQPIVGEALAFD